MASFPPSFLLFNPQDPANSFLSPQLAATPESLLQDLDALVNNLEVFPQEFTQHLFCLLILHGVHWKNNNQSSLDSHFTHWSPLLEKIFTLLACVGKSLKREYLSSFLASTLEPQAFLLAFQGLFAYLTSFVSYSSERKLLLAALCTMACFWEANLTLDLLHHSQFYLSTLSSQLDIKSEFIRWSTAPSTSILSFPWCLTLERKALLLRVQNSIQMRNELQDTFFRALFAGVQNPFLALEVRREHILADAQAALRGLPSHELRKQLKVKFVGEEGIDEGGLQKEFFSLVIRELAATGLFCDRNGWWWFHHSHFSALKEVKEEKSQRNSKSSKTSSSGASLCENYRLAGQLVGLAMYNSVLLDIQFPKILYKRLLAKENLKVELKDLKEIDPQLFASLSWISSMECTESEWNNLELDWTCQIDDNHTVTLGSGPLSWDKRFEYCSSYVEHVLIHSINRHFEAFQSGFFSACASPLLTQMLVPEELSMLVAGSPILDFEEWRKSARYDHGYHADHPLIQDFWSIVCSEQWDLEKRRKLLAFCTGSDRAPVGGLASVPLTIVRAGPDSDRLPSAHTCFNVLLLNEYSGGRPRLETMLSIAVENYEGFGLI